MKLKKGEISWYIIALVLAIAVLAISATLYYIYNSHFRDSLTEQECWGQKELYCGLWRIKGQKPEGKSFVDYTQNKCSYLDWAKKDDETICERATS